MLYTIPTIGPLSSPPLPGTGWSRLLVLLLLLLLLLTDHR